MWKKDSRNTGYKGLWFRKTSFTIYKIIKRNKGYDSSLNSIIYFDNQLINKLCMNIKHKLFQFETLFYALLFTKKEVRKILKLSHPTISRIE